MLLKSFFVIASFGGIANFAEAPSVAPHADWVTEFAKYGLSGLVLGFILYRLEPRMAKLEKAMNYLTQMIRLMLIEIKETSPGVRAQAVSIGEQMKADGIQET